MPFARILFLAALLLIAGSPQAHSDKLRLVANTWEPFTGQGLLNGGIASDIVVSVLKRAGHSVTIEVLPWTRVLKTVEMGKHDGMVGIWHTPEREIKVHFSKAYYKNRIVLLKNKKDDFRYVDFNSLNGLQIGVGRAYDYTPQFRDAANFVKKPAAKLTQNIAKLARERLDLVVSDEVIAEYHLSQGKLSRQNANDISVIRTPLYEIPLYFGISRTHPEHEKIIAAFNSHLNAFIADGSYERLIKNHRLYYGLDYEAN